MSRLVTPPTGGGDGAGRGLATGFRLLGSVSPSGPKVNRKKHLLRAAPAQRHSVDLS